MISIIAAIGKNRELGKDNKLIWHIPKDLKRFKKITSGTVVIMGRKTFESLGHPLPDRVNIVITRDKNYQEKGVVVCHSIEEAIENPKSEIRNPKLSNEIFIIGGGEIYRQGLKYTDKLYLTVVDKEFPEADTFFPDYSEFKKITFEEKHQDGNLQYKFIEVER
jgi:dihydrofolate reductase